MLLRTLMSNIVANVPRAKKQGEAGGAGIV